MQDPLSIIGSVLSKILSGFFRQNLIFIVAPTVLLIALIVVGTRAAVQLAPVVKENINAAAELVQKVNEMQSGFNTALEKIAGLQTTIERIEKIINKIPSRLLMDNVDETTEESEEIIEEDNKESVTEPVVPVQPRNIIRRRVL